MPPNLIPRAGSQAQRTVHTGYKAQRPTQRDSGSTRLCRCKALSQADNLMQGRARRLAHLAVHMGYGIAGGNGIHHDQATGLEQASWGASLEEHLGGEPRGLSGGNLGVMAGRP